MQVRVKLFASLCQCRAGSTPGTPFNIELPDSCTVSQLATLLSLPSSQVKVIFVNGRARPLDWLLAADDEIGIFPPIGGG